MSSPGRNSESVKLEVDSWRFRTGSLGRNSRWESESAVNANDHQLGIPAAVGNAGELESLPLPVSHVVILAY